MADDKDQELADEQEQPTLDQQIALKYDPQALSRLVMRDAGRGEVLDLHTRSQMERRLGGDFSNVRLFRGPLAEEITRRYRADAITVGGTDMILVREGFRANVQSPAGQSLLAHELTHVQQQQRGLHFAHTGGEGGGENSDIEREAEAQEARVHAEEQGHPGAQEAQRHAARKEQQMWAQVKKEVLQMIEEHETKQHDRHGD